MIPLEDLTPAGPPEPVERDDGVRLWRFPTVSGGTIDVEAPTVDAACAQLEAHAAAYATAADPAPALEHRLAEQLERLDPATADAAAIVGAVLSALRPVDSATVSPATTSKAP